VETARHWAKKTQAVRPRRAEQGSSKPTNNKADPTEGWRREYYIPDYSIQRAARDLLSHSVTSEIEHFAGAMFALQDLVDNEDLDNISEIEKESDSPFFRIAAGTQPNRLRYRVPRSEKKRGPEIPNSRAQSPESSLSRLSGKIHRQSGYGRSIRTGFARGASTLDLGLSILLTHGSTQVRTLLTMRQRTLPTMAQVGQRYQRTRLK